MSSSVHIDNKGQDILILGAGQTQGLEATTLIVEAKYTINFTQPNKRFLLSVHYSHSFLFVNATKTCQFKAKDSEVKNYTLCLGNTSEGFSINNMKKTAYW